MKLVSLDTLNKDECGIIRKFDATSLIELGKVKAGEIEDRLLEMGFIEGIKIQVMHLGYWGRDPIAVRINNSNTVLALRKREAQIIFLEIV